MSVTKEQVEYIASLAKLHYSEDELDRMTDEMDQLVAFANSLEAIDTQGVEPTAHILGQENVLRMDGHPIAFDTEKALMNAPDRNETSFAVPKVVE